MPRGQVAEFRLPKNNLTGPLPSRELAAFQFLLVVDLSGNRLTGALPSFAGLERLELMDLSDNELAGGIPEDMRPQTCCGRAWEVDSVC